MCGLYLSAVVLSGNVFFFSILCAFISRLWCVRGFPRPAATLTPDTVQHSALVFVFFILLLVVLLFGPLQYY